MTDLVTQPLLFMLLGAVVVSARVHVCEAKWSVRLLANAAAAGGLAFRARTGLYGDNEK